MIEVIKQKRDAVVELCQRFGVRRLDVFGSAAKGTFDPVRSDLDFLVTIQAASPGQYADNYLDLANALEALFGRRVDLVTERSIRNPYFRQSIQESRQLVYEA